MSVKQNYEDIQAVLRAACKRTGRNPELIHIIAVTKYVSIERAKEAVDAGVLHLGENRPEEAMEKHDALGRKATWHFIGNLQSKKVKKIIHAYDYIHSLDRLSLAKEINKRARESVKIKCFVQVNVSGESSKSGVTSDETLPFIQKLADYPSIEVVGLMTMAPLTDNKDILRETFKSLRELKETIAAKNFAHAPCTELSMGMSNDFEIAVEEGATFVRIGSSLVGHDKEVKA
ncbi:YggS family pyridoxal phosphate-dependent enzyme [Bacillus sp. A301a_S52]|nr:YggS family pyridoxal phosphate-dependent enzyme [Bacillus sp. A301a_S52]